MPRQFKPSRRDLNLERMFETRSDAWERVGLSIDVDDRESETCPGSNLVGLLHPVELIEDVLKVGIWNAFTFVQDLENN